MSVSYSPIDFEPPRQPKIKDVVIQREPVNISAVHFAIAFMIVILFLTIE